MDYEALLGRKGSQASSAPAPSGTNYDALLGRSSSKPSYGLQIGANANNQDRIDKLNQIGQGKSKLKYQDQIIEINKAIKDGFIAKQDGLDLINKSVDVANPIKGPSTFDTVVTAVHDIPKMAFDATIGAAGNTVGNAIDAGNTAIKLGDARRAVDNLKTQNAYIDSLVKQGKITQAHADTQKQIGQAKADQLTEAARLQKMNSDQIDPIKAIGDAATTALNIATLGGAGLLKTIGEVGVKTGVNIGTKVTAETAVKEATKRSAVQVLKKTGINIAKDVPLGAAYGVTGTAASLGKDATAEDYKNNALFGAATGGVLATAGGALRLSKTALSEPLSGADAMISQAITKVTGKIGQSSIGQSAARITDKVASALGDSSAPIYRKFKGLKDADGNVINEQLRRLDGNVSNAASVGSGLRAENTAFQELKVLVAPDKTRAGSLKAARTETQQELAGFVSKKQDALNHNKLNPDNPIEIPTGTPKQEKAYGLLNQSTKHDIQNAYDSGLITKANYTKYMADKDYTRVQRDLADEVGLTPQGTGSANGSIASTTMGQRLKGSYKKALDPFAAYVDWSNRLAKESGRAKLSSYIIDNAELHQINAGTKSRGFLRKSDTVEYRQRTAADASQLRVLRNGLGKIVQSESKQARKLQSELANLNRQGKDASIKNAGSTAGVKPKSGIKAHIDNLEKTSTADLDRIKAKIGNRDKKLADHVQNIINVKTQHEAVSKIVRDAYASVKLNTDKTADGALTIKTIRRGIKEVYETDPLVVEAINKLGVVETHAVIRFFQAPSRLIQKTATGLNFVFGFKNLGRDQLSSSILSKNVLATHNPYSFWMGLQEAALKPTGKALLKAVGARKTADKLLNPSTEYADFLKYIAGSTRVDITRGVKSTARAAYEELGLKNPGFINKLENINGATENLTRFQNYIGTYKSALKKGKSIEQAQKEAIQAGRENSVDFSKTGDFTPFMKIFNPFINANIQGSRSMVRAFAERPLGTSLKVATTVLAPVAASTYYNLADPHRALLYSALSESDKKANLIFITGDGNVLKIPMPPGFRSLADPVRVMVEAQYGMGDKQNFLTVAKSMFDSINPVDPSNMVPQAVKPIVENISNHSFYFNAPLVPDYLKDKETQDQVYNSTGQTYRDLGSATGISPLLIKNLVTGYGSSVGEQTVSAIDQGRKLFDKNVVTDNRDAVHQLKSAFYDSPPDVQQKANTVFYDSYDPLKKQRDKVSTQITTLIQDRKNNEATRIANDFNDSLAGKFNSVKKYGWNTSWDDQIKTLIFPTTDRAFKARAKEKTKGTFTAAN